MLREAASRKHGGPGRANAGAASTSDDDGQADAADVIARLTRERDAAVTEASAGIWRCGRGSPLACGVGRERVLGELGQAQLHDHGFL